MEVSLEERHSWRGPLVIAALARRSDDPGPTPKLTPDGVGNPDQWCVIMASCDPYCRSTPDEDGSPLWPLIHAGTEYAEKRGWADTPSQAWELAQPLIRRLIHWGWLVLDQDGDPLIKNNGGGFYPKSYLSTI